MPSIVIAYLTAPELMDQLVAWLPVATMVLQFLSALCGFLVGTTLLGRRIRRWLRRRRSPRA